MEFFITDPEELLEIEHQNEYAALNNGVILDENESTESTEDAAGIQGLLI